MAQVALEKMAESSPVDTINVTNINPDLSMVNPNANNTINPNLDESISGDKLPIINVSATANTGTNSSSFWTYAIIGGIVLAGGGTAYYYYNKKKKLQSS